MAEARLDRIEMLLEKVRALSTVAPCPNVAIPVVAAADPARFADGNVDDSGPSGQLPAARQLKLPAAAARLPRLSGGRELRRWQRRWCGELSGELTCCEAKGGGLVLGLEVRTCVSCTRNTLHPGSGPSPISSLQPAASDDSLNTLSETIHMHIHWSSRR